jgi:hypothetical protein
MRLWVQTVFAAVRQVNGTVLNEPIAITSILKSEHRPALEQLLFFNVNQHRVRPGIQHAIETYGVPEIADREGLLRIRVGDIDGVQSLFAVSETGSPIGVALFMRLARDRFVVLHLGVAADSAAAGPASGGRVLLRLMHEIRAAARRTRGVERIELVYKERHPARANA